MAYEDFTTYTEVDEGGNVTVAASKISWVDLVVNENTYVYKDFGADHFDGDFEFQFEWQFDNLESDGFAGIALTTAAGAYMHHYDNALDAQMFYSYGNASIFSLTIMENGATDNYDDASFGPVAGTTYYITFIRDDDAGANNTGRLTAEIRTGSHTGTLQETLTADCAAGEQNDFRYLQPLMGGDVYGGSATIDGFVQNLDIGEEAAFTVYGKTISKIYGITPSKIMGR